MEKTVILFICLSLFSTVFAQQYNIDKLIVISTIWGESYLFHPSVIRADKNIEWEKQLVEFLPQIKDDMTKELFYKTINSGLLSKLEDPFTVVQNIDKKKTTKNSSFQSNKLFEYLKITENQLSDISYLAEINNKITDRISKKPLVVDLRIGDALILDRHTNTFFDYFASMLIDKTIPLSLSVAREHFGWDEYNDWWFYEQKWKIAYKDKQLAGNGQLKPISGYSQELQQYLPGANLKNFTSIKRPVYFLTNNSFLSYYKPLLIALKTNRAGTFVVNENSGRIHTPEFSGLISYKFDKFEFVLNPHFFINNNTTGLVYDLNNSSINSKQIIDLINSKQDSSSELTPISLGILPKKYTSANQNLSVEEKILGIIKVWTIVKYFYVHHDLSSINWENSLGQYLTLAQTTSTDKEYYILIQEMMAKLNDSHVSTFHPSILDFSKIFVAPVNFEGYDINYCGFLKFHYLYGKL